MSKNVNRNNKNKTFKFGPKQKFNKETIIS